MSEIPDNSNQIDNKGFKLKKKTYLNDCFLLRRTRNYPIPIMFRQNIILKKIHLIENVCEFGREIIQFIHDEIEFPNDFNRNT